MLFKDESSKTAGLEKVTTKRLRRPSVLRLKFESSAIVCSQEDWYVTVFLLQYMSTCASARLYEFWVSCT